MSKVVVHKGYGDNQKQVMTTKRYPYMMQATPLTDVNNLKVEVLFLYFTTPEHMLASYHMHQSAGYLCLMHKYDGYGGEGHEHSNLNIYPYINVAVTME